MIYKMFRSHTGNEIIKFIDNFQHTRSNNVDLTCPQFRTALYKNSILCLGPKPLTAYY